MRKPHPNLQKWLRAVQAEEVRSAIFGPVVDFVPHAHRVLGDEFTPPHHLRHLVRALERAIAGERVRFAFSVPPQHGKTNLLISALAQFILRDPKIEVAFASYTASRAREVSKKVMTIAEHFGAKLENQDQSHWRTTSYGGMKAGGIDHGFTGGAFDICIVDDPYDGREGAGSEAKRAAVEHFIVSTLEKRCRAIILVHTRWEPDDAIGRRLKDDDWEVVNVPAICDDEEADPLGRSEGEALWPEYKPVSFFKNEMKNIRDWISLYQGRPRPSEQQVFQPYDDAWFYPVLPDEGNDAMGLDFGFTIKTSSDYSVIALCRRVMRTHKGQNLPFYYFWGVERVRELDDQFVNRVASARSQLKRCRIVGYFAGTGDIAQTNSLRRVQIHCENLFEDKKGDKLVRAMDMAASWNDGRVCLPSEGATYANGKRMNTLWVEDFLDEFHNFTGSGQRHDDQVDAAVAAHDALRARVRSSVVGAHQYTEVEGRVIDGEDFGSYAAGKRSDLTGGNRFGGGGF